jgi:hypothetical protein
MSSVARLRELLIAIPDEYQAFGTNSGNLGVTAPDGSRWAYLLLKPVDEEARVIWYNRKKHA